jgi:hypothetical protein
MFRGRRLQLEMALPQRQNPLARLILADSPAPGPSMPRIPARSLPGRLRIRPRWQRHRCSQFEQRLCAAIVPPPRDYLRPDERRLVTITPRRCDYVTRRASRHPPPRHEWRQRYRQVAYVLRGDSAAALLDLRVFHRRPDAGRLLRAAAEIGEAGADVAERRAQAINGREDNCKPGDPSVWLKPHRLEACAT